MRLGQGVEDLMTLGTNGEDCVVRPRRVRWLVMWQEDKGGVWYKALGYKREQASHVRIKIAKSRFY